MTDALEDRQPTLPHFSGRPARRGGLDPMHRALAPQVSNRHHADIVTQIGGWQIVTHLGVIQPCNRSGFGDASRANAYNPQLHSVHSMLLLRTGHPMIRHIAFVALLAALATPVAVTAATLNGNGMMNKWAASDRCAAQAHKAFPDFNAESNAKRDAAMKNCLASQNLPPRGDLDRK